MLVLWKARERLPLENPLHAVPHGRCFRLGHIAVRDCVLCVGGVVGVRIAEFKQLISYVKSVCSLVWPDLTKRYISTEENNPGDCLRGCAEG